MAKNLVICTGFDIFHGHEDKNASWEAVKLLPSSINLRDKEFELKKLLVKVEYEAVDEVVPKIWDQKPAIKFDYKDYKLVVHCGVSHLASTVTLEACSYNINYCKPDYSKKCPKGEIAQMTQNGRDKKILLTNLNVKRIAEELNGIEVDDCACESPMKDKFVCSKNVGNYLCGYIFLKSLDVDQDRSLFIHVPRINEPLSSEETSKRIFQVIQKCLEQLDEVKLL